MPFVLGRSWDFSSAQLARGALMSPSDVCVLSARGNARFHGDGNGQPKGRV
jgi:hypothetical protein